MSWLLEIVRVVDKVTKKPLGWLRRRRIQEARERQIQNRIADDLTTEQSSTEE